MLIERCPLR